MFYHVSLEWDDHTTLVETDYTSIDDIVKDVISPYLDNSTFIFSGYRIEPKYIERLNVFESGQQSHELKELIGKEFGITMHFDSIAGRLSFALNRYSTNITRSVIRQARSLAPQSQLAESKKLSKSKAFIVHGHDRQAQLEVQAFLTAQGIEGIILNEKPNAGQTIIEKIEATSDVGFAIILYTPCDVGGKSQTTLQSRARQNVVFEHGYLIAKIGRENVCPLVKGHVETPSDISGIVYTSMDDHGAWKMTLAREMRSAGYNIDMNKF